MKTLPLIAVAFVLLVLGGLVVPPASAPLFYRAVLLLACVAAAVSAFLTTGRFAPGEKLFATWLVFGLAYALAAIRHGSRVVSLTVGHDVLPKLLLDGLLIAQNVLVAVALILFVRTWRATGLAVPGSRSAQTLSIVLGFAVALIVGGFPLLRGIQTAGTDIVLLVSTLGDVIGIALMVPLAMPALALRGGLLMHTWAYLAASELAWLAYDVWLAVQPVLGVDPRPGKAVEEVFRILAVSFALLASVAQRRAIDIH